MSLPLRDVRVPTRLQFQTTECGVAALAMVLAHHGRHVGLEELRAVTGVSRDCVNAAEIARAARHYGLECKAYTREPDALADLPRPFLAHLRFIHFVVVEGITETEVLICDPNAGRSRMPLEGFNEAFTGIVLAMTPGVDFCAGGRPVQPLRALWQRLPASGCKAPLLAAVSAGLAAALLLPVLACLLGAWVDVLTVASAAASGAVPGALSGVTAVGLGAASLAAWLVLTGLLHATLLWGQWHAAGRLGARLAAGQARLLARHFMALPARFFVYRLPDKLHEALYSGDAAAQLLAHKVLPGALRLALLPVALVALAWLAPAAAAAVAALGLLCIAAQEAVYLFRGDAARGRAVTAHSDLGALLFGRSELEQSKLGGKERDFLLSRFGTQARSQKSIQEAGEAAALQRSAALVFALGAMAIVLLASASAFAAQRASLGNAVAMLLLAIACALALRHYAPLRGDLDALAHLLLPVEDVLACPPETPAMPGSQELPATLATPAPPASSATPATSAAGVKHHFSITASLPAGIALRATALSFGYSATRAPLIHNISLSLVSGEQLGLTGPSGGGKSTLAGLLAGDRQPWSGMLEIAASIAASAAASAAPDATAEANARHFVAWVDKSAFFFDGSIRENLCLWQSGVSDHTLQQAISDACLDDVLAARPGGLEARVMERGRNFSGGQRQRLEIARALLRQPTIVILDEATDALDPALEARVRANLRRRGCTLVMVSHRASTLAGCERVLRVEGGTLVEGAAAGQSMHPVAAPVEQSVVTAPAGSPASALADAPAGLPAGPPAGPPVDNATPAESARSTDALLPAVQLIAKLLGASSTPSHAAAPAGAAPACAAPAAATPGPDLITLARRHGLHARNVRFVVPAWWRRNAAVLIAWRKDSGAPVVVLPAARGQRLIDPASAQEIALPPDALQTEACAFERAIETDASPAQWLRQALQQHLPASLQVCRQAWLQALGVSLLLVASLLVLPALVWQAFDPQTFDPALPWAARSAAGTLLGSTALASTALATAALGLAALIAAIALIDYCRSTALLRATGLLELAVNAAFVQKMPALAPAFLARTATADIARSLGAVQQLFERVRGTPLQSLLDAPRIAAALVLLALIDARTAALAALCAALVLLAPWALARSGLAVEAACAAGRSVARRFLFDVLAGLFRLRLLGASERALEQWLVLHAATLAQEKPLRAIERQAEHQTGWLADAMLPLAVLLTALAAALPGGTGIGAGIGTSGPSLAALPAILLLTCYLLEAACNTGAALVTLLRARPLLAQACLAAAAPAEPAAAPQLDAEPQLELQQLSYRYAGTAASARPALEQISLTIQPGQFIAITGPSGGGKSTLLRLLAGLECAHSGRMLLNGAPLEAAQQVALRQRIGMVSQDERLQSASTLRSQISGYAAADVHAVWQVCQTVLLADDIRRMPMGLQTIVESSGLSTGQEQRLLIARELLRQPQILILDEATNAIPDSMQTALFANLRQLCITCILVTHRETAIAQMDQVLVLEGGSIAWAGPPQALQQQARLAAMLRAERQEGHL